MRQFTLQPREIQRAEGFKVLKQLYFTDNLVLCSIIRKRTATSTMQGFL